MTQTIEKPTRPPRGIAFFTDYLDEFDLLDDAEFGRVVRAVLLYAADGTETAFDDRALTGAYRTMKGNLERSREYQRYISEINTQNRRAGNRRQSEPISAPAEPEQSEPISAPAEPPSTNDNDTEQSSTVDDGRQRSSVSSTTCPTRQDKTRQDKTRQDKTKQNNTRKDTSLPPTPKGADRAFAVFWEAYPRKQDRRKAQSAFGRIPAKDIPAAMSGLSRAKCSDQWTRDGGRYIPFAATWLNGRRWEDELETEQASPDLSTYSVVPEGWQTL